MIPASPILFMPIKFRCPHCQQFLGISPSKAGQLADCPACGRSIRVPNLDGTIAPLPRPSLNFADPKLASALDQLASLHENADEDSAEPATTESTPPAILSLEPLPQRAVIELPPPRPAVPVILPEPQIEEQQPEPFEQPIAGSPAETLRKQPPSRFWPRWSAGDAGRLAAAACLGAVLAFGVGYLVGRSGARTEAPQVLRGAAVLSEGTGGLREGIAGRISYKTGTGESRPDAGARLVLIPETLQGRGALPVNGFRPGDSDIEQARIAISELGGALGVADSAGRFEMEPPGPGRYRVLILSHYQPREPDDAMNQELRRTLADLFDRPDQLLGRRAYYFGPLTYRGDGVMQWDHSF